MAKKKNARTAKKLDKRVVKREIENDNVVERREPPKKRIKKTTDSPAPHDSQPQATSGKRRRGKKVAKSDTEEPSEDIKAVKIEVKGETDAPTKKFKKGEDVPVPRPLKYESLGSGPPPVPFTGRKYMGSHVSAAGGIWNAFDNAKECNSKSFAIFLRNQRQWNAKPLDEETVLKWKEVGKVSCRKPGDHLDRHENIGKGTIGLEGFRRVMNCDHFNDLPLILETPWTSNAGYAKISGSCKTWRIRKGEVDSVYSNQIAAEVEAANVDILAEDFVIVDIYL
ncbi:putative endonuclease 4 [Portunus trituberculatus]|uniref:Putative endonuclease 4 n=1 Tax=Portunus trituberculatus TaxID=210409 RepID=A0A5B7CQ25_PORTR|nr:putative endonuclease 4 [Portunus trituberculatus]